MRVDIFSHYRYMMQTAQNLEIIDYDMWISVIAAAYRMERDIIERARVRERLREPIPK
jgi:hypothetical protein